MRPRINAALTAAALLLALVVAGCAAATASRAGREAEFRQDYDRAVIEYTKALRLNPNDAGARDGLQRSKTRASEDHLSRARRLAAVNKLDEAVVEYGVAAELNPTSSVIDDEMKTTRNKLRARVAVAREGKTELQTLVERTRDLPPPGLDLPANVRMPASLTFRDASSRDVFTTIARFGGIGLVFDTQFRDAPISVDLRNASLETALDTVSAATRTFYRVTAPQTVVIVPDSPAKRRDYEEEIVRTFYLSNADLKETLDLLRVVLDARRVSPITATNAVTIKDTPEHIAAAARVIAAIDKARPEVVVDVELLEVDRTRLLEYGLQIASPDSPGLNGSVTTSEPTLTLQALKNLTQSNVLFANLPGLYYRLLKTDTNTRTLANPQLRSSEGVTATARFGDQIPIPVTTFTPFATGGLPQQPITSFNYQNVGVNIDITPRTHHDGDVTLQLNIAITSVTGTGTGPTAGIPTLGNREIKTQIRLRDGETNLLAGLIRDDERKNMDGIPGLSDIPGVGRMFAHSTKTSNQTDIVMTLTPHIVRVLDLSESDLRPFRVSKDSLTPAVDLPNLLLPPPPPSAAPAAPGTTTPAPAPTQGPSPTAAPIQIPPTR
ncbi:MAG TPA: secretin N-terminal domain-containing protein [Vicinamibacterales bacterium]|nr:secretin N-terminal domain-containing protein [Vicinamibacterales bacterium]